MRLRVIILASVLFLAGLVCSAVAQEDGQGESWFMSTGKTSRGGYRLPVLSGGLQTPTRALLMKKVDTYPEISVTLERPSPFDVVLRSENLRADMLFDLSVLQLTDFAIDTRLR